MDKVEKSDVGLSELKSSTEKMKTGAAVYKDSGSKPSPLHSFNPDSPVELVKSSKENLVQSVKTAFDNDPAFKERLIQELNLMSKPVVEAAAVEAPQE